MKRYIRSRYETLDSEDAITLGAITSWTHEEPRGVVLCHGYGASAGSQTINALTVDLMYELSQFATVRAQDFGGQTWGNDAGTDKVHTAIAQMRSTWGVAGKVALVGISMGGCVVLNYTKRFPDDVACVAAAIGLTDLGTLYDSETGYDASIDAAYGGSFDTDDRNNHSPQLFINSIPPSLPISLWTSTNDPIVYPAWHAAFKAARPQTDQFLMGDLGHGFTNTQSALLAQWISDHM